MKKKSKKPKIILKVIIVLILCIGCGIGTYYLTYHIDKSKNGGDVKLTVTFDDTTSYVMPTNEKLDKDKALEEWPYIMHLSNKGTAIGLYQMLIKDTDDSTIKRDYLSYALFLGDSEIATGKLGDIKDNILYTSQIEGKQDQEYSLYIWVSEDIKEEPVDEKKEETSEEKSEEKQEEKKETKYEYKIEFNTIKAGGPGF